jgi:hypothetical protein
VSVVNVCILFIFKLVYMRIIVYPIYCYSSENSFSIGEQLCRGGNEPEMTPHGNDNMVLGVLVHTYV